MLGINARVEDLREQIAKDINAAHMPACIIDYVLTEILNDVRAKRMSEVQKERRLYREEKKTETVEAGEPAPGEAPAAKEIRRVKVPLEKPQEAEPEEGKEGGS